MIQGFAAILVLRVYNERFFRDSIRDLWGFERSPYTTIMEFGPKDDPGLGFRVQGFRV